MKRIPQSLRRCSMVLIAFVTSAGGCGGGRNADLARQAEERGDPAVAYDYYCRAAQDHRGSLTVADGLERTRPAAAAYWERLALTAADEGRYADAWRCWMRTIEIQPDHATAAQMIRQLETEHSTQIAAVREDWLKRGNTALPRAQLEPRRSVAKADAVRDSSPTEASQATTPAGSMARADGATLAARDPREPAPQPAKPPPRPRRPERSESQRKTREPTDKITARAADTSTDSAPGEEPVVHSERPAKRPAMHGGAPSLAGENTAFQVVRTYSLQDQRFPRTGDAIDGITLKLKDTDEDDGVIEVDVDLLKGGERIRKVRALRVGRSLTFRGASGQTYRMTIISAHHRTHTVRIGFRAE